MLRLVFDTVALLFQTGSNAFYRILVCLSLPFLCRRLGLSPGARALAVIMPTQVRALLIKGCSNVVLRSFVRSKFGE